MGSPGKYFIDISPFEFIKRYIDDKKNEWWMELHPAGYKFYQLVGDQFVFIGAIDKFHQAEFKNFEQYNESITIKNLHKRFLATHKDRIERWLKQRKL